MALKKTKLANLVSIETPSPKAVEIQDSLKVYFTYCLYKSALKLRYFLDRALDKHGLVAPHLGVIRLLNFSGSLSQSEIGKELDIDRASMVKLIDCLEKRGYVARVTSAIDRRVNKISLTAAGRKVFEKATRLREQVEDEFLAPLTTEEKTVVLRAIPKLLTHCVK